jgi:hypothetical protein
MRSIGLTAALLLLLLGAAQAESWQVVDGDTILVQAVTQGSLRSPWFLPCRKLLGRMFLKIVESQSLTTDTTVR